MSKAAPLKPARPTPLKSLVAVAFLVYLMGWWAVYQLYASGRNYSPALTIPSSDRSEPQRPLNTKEQSAATRTPALAEIWHPGAAGGPPSSATAVKPLEIELEPQFDFTPIDEPEEPQTTLSHVPIAPARQPPTEIQLKALAAAKCWTDKGLEYQGDQCDLPAGLELQFQKRLYLLRQCRQMVPAAKNQLDLGMEVDFLSDQVGFWTGPNADARGFDARVVECIRGELRRLPLAGIAHKFARYHLSMTVAFNRRAQVSNVVPEQSAEDINELLSEAQIVNVSRTKVRLRITPVDGRILGLLSAPDRVTLLQQQGEWCRVLTARKNIGWMVCWGLDLGDATPPKPDQ